MGKLANVFLIGALACSEPIDGDAGRADAGNGGRDAAVSDAAIRDAGSTEDAGQMDPACAIIAAPDATASSPCTLGAPCSIAGAQAQARARAPSLSEDLGVCLRGGVYFLDATLALGAEDSGANGHSVIWRSYPGERAVLAGGVPIGGWAMFDPARNLWRAPAPSGLRTRQLFVDAVRAFRTRGPFRPAGWVETATGYRAPDASLASFRNPSDLEIVAFRYWKSFRCPVASIAGADVTMEPACWALGHEHAAAAIGLPTWIENAYEYLGTPGFFHHDRTEGFIYYVPRAGEDLATATVIAPVLETLVSIRGSAAAPVHHVALEGLVIANSTWLAPDDANGYPVLQSGAYYTMGAPSTAFAIVPGAIAIEHAADVRLERNVFARLGATGLVLEAGSKRITIVGNVFSDISGAGVRIGNFVPAPADPDIVEDVAFTNNLVTDVGRELFDNPAVLIGYVRRTSVEHNEIRNAPYTGISLGWGWSLTPTVAAENRLANNLIHHVMRRLEDGGGIYTLSTQPGTVLEGNYLHDVLSPFAGLYFDQGSEHYVARGNVVVSVPNWYLLQPIVPPYAQGITVADNFSDTMTALCCGPAGCCTDASRMNAITGTTFFSAGAWPDAAAAIMTSAGLDAEHADLRPTSILVEAEDFAQGGEGIGYHDLTPTNEGAASGALYRAGDAVDVYAGWGFSGDHVVGYTQSGEWTRYYVDVRTSATYSITFSVGTQSATDTIEVEIDGTSAGVLALPNTGSWSSYQPATLSGIAVAPGPHAIRLIFTGGFNIDSFTLAP